MNKIEPRLVGKSMILLGMLIKGYRSNKINHKINR